MLTNHYNTLSKPISPNYVASPRQRIAMPLNYGENSFVAKVRLFCKLTINSLSNAHSSAKCNKLTNAGVERHRAFYS